MQSIHSVLILGTLAAATLTGAVSNLHHGISSGVLAEHRDKEERSERCDVQTLKGGYGLTFQGFGVRGPVPALIGAFIPAAGVGVMNFDGTGGLSLVETTSFGGHIGPLSTTGTYQVNPDCTGSLEAPGAAIWNFVIVHDGRQIMAINTIEGRVATVDLEKQ
jgi:hypothetical protein